MFVACDACNATVGGGGGRGRNAYIEFTITVGVSAAIVGAECKRGNDM